MGVEGAVQHQDRGMDRRERSRVYAFVPFFKPIGRSVYNGLQANLVQKRAAPISRRAHVELSDCGRFVVLQQPQQLASQFLVRDRSPGATGAARPSQSLLAASVRFQAHLVPQDSGGTFSRTERGHLQSAELCEL